MAGDPADVRHAPVDVFGMNVLDVLRRPGHVREVAADGVLAALGPSGRAARVHEEERRLGWHWDRVNSLSAIFGEKVVEDHVALCGERSRARVLAGMALPDQHFVDLMTLFG